MHKLIQRGLIALERGDRVQARAYFESVVLEDAHNITAWLCMAEALEEAWQKRFCLAYALDHNPDNYELEQALSVLPQGDQEVLDERSVGSDQHS